MKLKVWTRPPEGWVAPVPRPKRWWLKTVICILFQRHKPHHFIDYYRGFRTEGFRCQRCGGIGIRYREPLGYGSNLVSDQNPLAVADAVL